MTTDSQFRESVLRGDDVTLFVARWFHRRGKAVRIPGLHIRPEYGDRFQYSDHGDLEVCYRVETKGLKHELSGKWPFPDFMVCRIHKWDQAVPKPTMFIFAGPSRDTLAIVRASSSEKWVQRQEWASNEQRYEKYYFTPLDTVEFIPIDPS